MQLKICFLKLVKNTFFFIRMYLLATQNLKKKIYSHPKYTEICLKNIENFIAIQF